MEVYVTSYNYNEPKLIEVRLGTGPTIKDEKYKFLTAFSNQYAASIFENFLCFLMSKKVMVEQREFVASIVDFSKGLRTVTSSLAEKD